MSGDRKNLCGLGILIMGVVLLGSHALPKTGSVEGRSSLGIMQNSPPSRCWVETDCGPGEVCHLSITITGGPALKLLQVLKARVSQDEAFKEWGLRVYVSKDNLLSCDETDRNKPFCYIWYNPSEAKVEPALSCE